MSSFYLLLHHLAFINSKNEAITKFYISFKLFFMYVFYIIIILIGIYYFYNILQRKQIVEKDNNSKYSYPESLLNKKIIAHSFGILLLLPYFLSFYFDHTFILKTNFDIILVSIFKLVLFTVLIFYLVSNCFDKNNLNSILSEKDGLKNIIMNGKLINNIKTSYIEFYGNLKSLKISIRIFLLKIIIIALLFLPLFIFSISGTLKTTIFDFLEIETDISANFSLHILFSILEISNSSGLSIGNKGFLFLKNINENYFFLPTSYYSNPIDILYGVFASAIWFVTLIVFIKIILTIKRSNIDKKRLLKLFLKFFFLIFLWLILSIGLFKPSSFISKPPVTGPGDPQEPSGSDLISGNIIENFSIFLLPIGFIIQILIMFYLLINILNSKFKKKDSKEFNQENY